MTRVDLVFPSMGGEARVRLESVLFDEAELAALADGIHSQIEAVEGLPDGRLVVNDEDKWIATDHALHFGSVS